MQKIVISLQIWIWCLTKHRWLAGHSQHAVLRARPEVLECGGSDPGCCGHQATIEEDFVDQVTEAADDTTTVGRGGAWRRCIVVMVIVVGVMLLEVLLVVATVIGVKLVRCIVRYWGLRSWIGVLEEVERRCFPVEGGWVGSDVGNLVKWKVEFSS